MSGISIQFEPTFSLGILSLLSVLLVAAAFIHVRAAPYAAFFRLLAAVFLLALMLNPVVTLTQYSAKPTTVLLVNDQSLSQRITGRSKLAGDVTQAIANELKKLSQPRSELDVREVMLPASGQAGIEEESTELFKALEDTIASLNPAQLGGVVIISDGQIHDAARAASTLPKDVPLNVLLTGALSGSDRALEITSAPQYGVVGSEAVLSLRINTHGEQPESGARTELIVSSKGKPDVKTLVPFNQPVQLNLPVDTRGPNGFVLKIPHAQGEASPLNNTANITIHGIQERLRVLLVSGEPNPGERTWRSLLKSDPSVDLIHYTILRPPTKFDGTPLNQLSLIGIPIDEIFATDIDSFDLIIFDRYTLTGILSFFHLENIASYVERGGALLVINAPEKELALGVHDTPIARVLPTVLEEAEETNAFTPQLTPLGRRHPITRTLLEDNGEQPHWGPWYRILLSRLTNGHMLLEDGRGNPLLVIGESGEGRAAELMSDQAWLWARGHEGGGPYGTLFRRLLHWLMREPELEADTLSVALEDGALTIKREKLEGTPGPVEVTAPTGERFVLKFEQTAPATWHTTFEEPKLGPYTFREGEAELTTFIGAQGTQELADLRVYDAILRPLVDTHKGRMFEIKDAAKLPPIRLSRTLTKGAAKYITIRETQETEKKTHTLSVFAVSLYGFLLVLATLAALWWVESRTRKPRTHRAVP